MHNITIGRYQPLPAPIPGVTDITDEFDGWIEGTRDDGSTWIMWLAADGSPQLYWADREPDGGTIGDPIILTPQQ